MYCQQIEQRTECSDTAPAMVHRDVSLVSTGHTNCTLGKCNQRIGMVIGRSIHATSKNGNPQWWCPYHDVRLTLSIDTAHRVGNGIAEIVPSKCTHWSTWIDCETAAMVHPVAKSIERPHKPLKWNDVRATSLWSGIHSLSILIRESSTYNNTKRVKI